MINMIILINIPDEINPVTSGLFSGYCGFVILFILAYAMAIYR
jgi:hypothetical protein